MAKVEESAGIAIICDKKILLCHSTNAKWFASYMPPKGVIEENESKEDAASRETMEEIGIDISPAALGKMHTVQYLRKGKHFKTVYIFEYHIDSLEEIGLGGDTIPEEMLQLEEIDYAKFMEYGEASIRILPRYSELLDTLINNG